LRRNIGATCPKGNHRVSEPKLEPVLEAALHDPKGRRAGAGGAGEQQIRFSRIEP